MTQRLKELKISLENLNKMLDEAEQDPTELAICLCRGVRKND